jgi:hypothetical protein
MSFNKTLLAAAAALSIIPAMSLAADFPMTVSVEAVVPAANGLQVSAVGGWDTVIQPLTWDIINQDLKPITKQLDIKSNADVHAYLTTDAVLTSSTDSLPMNVSIRGKPLLTGAANKVQLLTAAEANGPGTRVEFAISTTKPAAGYVEGKYSGQVFMMFESTLTP